jgi:hypothetical protein
MKIEKKNNHNLEVQRKNKKLDDNRDLVRQRN